MIPEEPTCTVHDVTSVGERLGRDPGDRLLILTADLLGMCHASNVGVYDCLRRGLATGAGLMVPGPWARAAWRGPSMVAWKSIRASTPAVRAS